MTKYAHLRIARPTDRLEGTGVLRVAYGYATGDKRMSKEWQEARRKR